jgi:NAD(P)-dependent dehydrogenase (short-subunit alcohol dehydrogenase family)
MSEIPAGQLAGKVAWVTGAGGGIGRGIVAAYAAAGATVLATDVSADGPAPEGATIWAACDVRSEEQCAAVAARARAELGALDAVMRRQTLFEISARDWDDVFDVNAKGVFLSARAAAAEMVRGGRGGCIVTLCSLGAEIPRHDIIQYSASKGAVQTLTAALAVALAPEGIRVAGIMPGTIRTEMGRDRWSVPGAEDAASAKIPLRRLGRPGEIAPLAVFLASDQASYITGSVLRADGGRLVNG